MKIHQQYACSLYVLHLTILLRRIRLWELSLMQMQSAFISLRLKNEIWRVFADPASVTKLNWMPAKSFNFDAMSSIGTVKYLFSSTEEVFDSRCKAYRLLVKHYKDPKMLRSKNI